MNVIRFCLNTFKNSQFVNVIVFLFVYVFIFLVCIFGYGLTYHESTTSAVLVRLTTFFFGSIDSGAQQISTDGSALIQYYILFLGVAGFIQEMIMFALQRIFKRDFRAQLSKFKNVSLIVFITFCTFSEIVIAFLVKEYWVIVLALGAFAGLVISYAWYRVVIFLIDKIEHVLAQPLPRQ